jgi:hypothetical protein
MSPLKVLARGYAIATRASDARAVRDATEVAPGDRVRVRVAGGAFDADVVHVTPAADGPASGGEEVAAHVPRARSRRAERGRR